MRNGHTRHSLLSRLCTVSTVIAVLAAAFTACNIGGKEGDRCNPLVLRDECNSGLYCKAATCSESYCCPVDRSSGDPNCNGQGCPDTDGGDEGGGDAAADSGSPADGGGAG